MKNEEIQSMDGVVEDLIRDLLEWLAARDRTYEEVMNTWRTSCPRLPVWEDANDRGLVVRVEVNGRSLVGVTSPGLALIAERTLSNPRPLIDNRLTPELK